MKKEKIYKCFSKMPVLETQRLVLRKIELRDYEDMYEYSKDPSVTEYLLWSPHKDCFYTREYIQYINERYKIGEFYDWAVEYRENRKMIGTCGFTKFDFNANSAEIGYVLNPEYRGRGLAAEAVSEVIRFGFERLELNRIEARFMQGNHASFRVMQKCNMTFEGYARESMLVKGVYRTIGYCSLLASEYRKEQSKILKSRSI